MFSFSNHQVASQIHKYTSKMAVILIAAKNGYGKIIDLELGDDYESKAKVREDECLIGIYSDFDVKKHGITYKMKIPENFFDKFII